MTDADDAGLLGAGNVSENVTDPADIAVLAGESERARFKAEVESLRMALREIATLDADRWSIHRAVQIARVALTRGPAA